MTEPFRFVYLPNLEGREFQMMREALLKLVSRGKSPNTLVITYPSKGYVKMGRHANLSRKVRTEYCIENKIPIIRSITPSTSSGYHDSQRLRGQLIFSRDSSLYAPVNRPLLYEAAVNSLKKLGVRVIHPSWSNNLLVGDKKIVGVNVWDFGKAMIFAITIFLGSSVDQAEKVIISPKDMRRYTTSVKTELDREVSVEEMRDAVLDAYQQTLQVTFEDGVLSVEEEALIESLRVKHESEVWIKTGSWSLPPSTIRWGEPR